MRSEELERAEEASAHDGAAHALWLHIPVLALHVSLRVQGGIYLDRVFSVVFLRIAQEEVLGFHILRDLGPSEKVEWTHVEVAYEDWVILTLVLLDLRGERKRLFTEQVACDRGATGRPARHECLHRGPLIRTHLC